MALAAFGDTFPRLSRGSNDAAGGVGSLDLGGTGGGLLLIKPKADPFAGGAASVAGIGAGVSLTSISPKRLPPDGAGAEVISPRKDSLVAGVGGGGGGTNGGAGGASFVFKPPKSESPDGCVGVAAASGGEGAEAGSSIKSRRFGGSAACGAGLGGLNPVLDGGAPALDSVSRPRARSTRLAGSLMARRG